MIPYCRIHVILVTLVLPLLFSCASNQQLKTAGDRSGIVLDIGDYTIVHPSGGEWSVAIDRGKGTFSAEKLKKWWTGNILGITLIMVFQNKVMSEEKRSLSEEQVANEYRNTEDHIMKEAAQRGEYDLEEVRKVGEEGSIIGNKSKKIGN